MAGVVCLFNLSELQPKEFTAGPLAVLDRCACRYKDCALNKVFAVLRVWAHVA